MDERMTSKLKFLLIKIVFLYLAKKLVKSTETKFDDELLSKIEKVLDNAG